MPFHPEKCELLKVTNKLSPFKEVYKMNDHILKEIDDKNYLGLTLESKLNWNTCFFLFIRN